jgi:hypothetical protein
MPVLGAPLDFSQYEGKQLRAHQLGTAPASPVTGQLYYNTANNTLWWWNGSAWISALGGYSPPDATTGSKGVIQLAGDLTGSATTPTIANGAVTSAKILDGTITDVDVAGANKDGIVGTYSMRTLGLGAQQAFPGNGRIDQLVAPTAPVSFGSQRITTLADPSVAQDAATKNYVDSVAAGISAKAAVVCATTANITLSGLQAIDGYTTLANDRVLVKNQTTASQNGIYVAATGAWVRATDNDSWAEMVSAYCWVEQGGQSDSGWVCTADPGGTINTTAVTWVQFTGAYQITAGAGLTKAGNTISALVDNASIDTAGAGSSLEIKAGGVTAAMHANGSVVLSSAVVTGTLPLANGGTSQTTAKAARETGLVAAGYYNNNATHGAGATITITQATHGLRSSRGIQVQVQDNTSGNVEIPDITVAANGDVTITYGTAVAANSKLVTLVG